MLHDVAAGMAFLHDRCGGKGGEEGGEGEGEGRGEKGGEGGRWGGGCKYQPKLRGGEGEGEGGAGGGEEGRGGEGSQPFMENGVRVGGFHHSQ